MTQFILAYHGNPDFSTEEEGADHMEAWNTWSNGLGDALIDPGMPVGRSVTITETEVINNGGANPLTGITIIQAENLEAAIQLAKDCPHIQGSGTIEVAEAMDLGA